MATNKMRQSRVVGSSQVNMQIAAVPLCNSEEIDFAPPPAYLLAGSMQKSTYTYKFLQGLTSRI